MCRYNCEEGGYKVSTDRCTVLTKLLQSKPVSAAIDLRAGMRLCETQLSFKTTLESLFSGFIVSVSSAPLFRTTTFCSVNSVSTSPPHFSAPPLLSLTSRFLGISPAQHSICLFFALPSGGGFFFMPDRNMKYVCRFFCPLPTKRI